ncbi:dipeptidase PepE [Cryobacterium adonitolivorans]|uniref:Dipeptidase PepE n=1 Tax=Cryobacterium adonitolivorans TaxID=1259189 RepID=A0A4V3IC79_9MICO|nr:dipeptidase PepE [Cryobacterium adonitolivorans]TFB99568.1 dipeptidase PepE [Cryobacterium adonitolivorans]
MQLLLLANCTSPGQGYLEHALPEVLAFLHGVTVVTFVPFAGGDLDAYTASVRAALEPHGIAARGLHEAADPVAAVASAQALFVGGGNTFRLLAALQRLGLIPVIRARVQNGLPYLGSSAGATITAPSIRTTNDMPIVQPESFDALGLVPFQINPHYLDTDPAGVHTGDSRESRLTEFLDENDVPVLGLREGTHLSVTSTLACALAVVGGGSADPLPAEPGILFERGRAPRNVAGDVSSLLVRRPRYDRPLAKAVS